MSTRRSIYGRVDGRIGSSRGSRTSRGHVDGRGRGRDRQHEGRQGEERQQQWGRDFRMLNITIMTTEDIVFYGLCLVGFGDKRQNVRPGLLHNRFLAFFGPDPKSVKDILNDLKEEFDDTSFKDTMMTLNWAKRYDVEHVLAGRWGYSEEYIGPKLKEIGKRIQSFVSKVIVFDPNLFDEREIHIITVDTFNCTTEEMRQTPSTAFYDHKSNSCGLKYEAALPIRHVSAHVEYILLNLFQGIRLLPLLLLSILHSATPYR